MGYYSYISSNKHWSYCILFGGENSKLYDDYERKIVVFVKIIHLIYLNVHFSPCIAIYFAIIILRLYKNYLQKEKIEKFKFEIKKWFLANYFYFWTVNQGTFEFIRSGFFFTVPHTPLTWHLQTSLFHFSSKGGKGWKNCSTDEKAKQKVMNWKKEMAGGVLWGGHKKTCTTCQYLCK